MPKIRGINKPKEEPRNHIINGNFDFWQRSLSSGTNQYVADRFLGLNANTGVPIFQERSTDVPTVAESGYASDYSFRFFQTGTGTKVNNTLDTVTYRMEGNDAQRLIGKKLTLSFWAKASAIGTFSVSVRSGTDSQSYVQTFTIDSASTWERKIINIDELPDDAGFKQGTSLGLHINFSFSIGSDFENATEGAWIPSNALAIPGQTDALSINNFECLLAQVQLIEGDAADSFRRAGDTIESELALCQRYYEKSYNLFTDPGTASFQIGFEAYSPPNRSFHRHRVNYAVTKRSNPTIVFYNTQTGAVQNGSNRDSGGGVITDFSTVGGNKGFSVQSPSHSANLEYVFHWASDSEL